MKATVLVYSIGLRNTVLAWKTFAEVSAVGGLKDACPESLIVYEIVREVGEQRNVDQNCPG